MRTTGIVFVIIGVLSTLAAVGSASAGYDANFGGIGVLILGVFLISRAKRKEAEQQAKREWEEKK